MKLFPSESFEIETTKNVVELVGLLRAETRPAPLGIADPSIMPLTLNDTLLVGNVTSEGFELRRNTKSWNWSPPHLFGVFRPSAVGTIINVNIRLARAREIGIGVLSLAITLASLGLVFSGEPAWFVLPCPAAFLGCLYAGNWLGVRGELSESRGVLEAICNVVERGES